MRKLIVSFAALGLLLAAPSFAQDSSVTDHPVVALPVVTEAPEVVAAGAADTVSAPNADTIVVNPDAIVTIPYGQYIADASSLLLDMLGPIVLVMFSWLARNLPMQAVQFLRMMRVEQLLKHSLQAGINATVGATKDKVLSVNVGSEVLASAVNYAIRNGSDGMIDWMGGKKGIEDKVFARLNLDETSNVQKVKQPL